MTTFSSIVKVSSIPLCIYAISLSIQGWTLRLILYPGYWTWAWRCLFNILISFTFFFFCSTGVWTQDLEVARQALYYLSHTSNSNFIYFGRILSRGLLDDMVVLFSTFWRTSIPFSTVAVQIYFLFLAVLGFEPRTLHLWGRCSTQIYLYLFLCICFMLRKSFPNPLQENVNI
jgi:hypothetical protein